MPVRSINCASAKNGPANRALAVTVRAPNTQQNSFFRNIYKQLGLQAAAFFCDNPHPEVWSIRRHKPGAERSSSGFDA